MIKKPLFGTRELCDFDDSDGGGDAQESQVRLTSRSQRGGGGGVNGNTARARRLTFSVAVKRVSIFCDDLTTSMRGHVDTASEQVSVGFHKAREREGGRKTSHSVQ